MKKVGWLPWALGTLGGLMFYLTAQLAQNDRKIASARGDGNQNSGIVVR